MLTYQYTLANQKSQITSLDYIWNICYNPLKAEALLSVSFLLIISKQKAKVVDVSIPESQLATWSHQGAITTSKATRASIYTALTNDRRLKDRTIDVYLQGSYRNDTNIRGESDVDVVVQLNDVCIADASHLSPVEAERHARASSKATYGWKDFRADVLSALQSYYGAKNVNPGNKSLQLKAASGRLTADIVPALQYRRYQRFISVENQSYIEGIWFQAQKDRRAIINFPKQHYDNGVNKNARGQTDGRFKPAVRIFKNARSYLIDHGKISGDLAPSYFIQCLLYNVPNRQFAPTYQDTYCNLLNWLSTAPLEKFRCQNEQLSLFGDTPEQWSIVSARAFIKALAELWKGWK